MTKDNTWVLVGKYLDGDLSEEEHTELMLRLEEPAFRQTLVDAARLLDCLPELEYQQLKAKMAEWRK